MFYSADKTRGMLCYLFAIPEGALVVASTDSTGAHFDFDQTNRLVTSLPHIDRHTATSVLPTLAAHAQFDFTRQPNRYITSVFCTSRDLVKRPAFVLVPRIRVIESVWRATPLLGCRLKVVPCPPAEAVMRRPICPKSTVSPSEPSRAGVVRLVDNGPPANVIRDVG
jgi:hypothetical protein